MNLCALAVASRSGQIAITNVLIQVVDNEIRVNLFRSFESRIMESLSTVFPVTILSGGERELRA